MIVITSLSRKVIQLEPKDTFMMTVTQEGKTDTIITEEITVAKIIDYVATYRFALADGTCQGVHLSSIFANSNELPDEIKNAVMLEDLTLEQYTNFINSVGIKIKRSGGLICVLPNL